MLRVVLIDDHHLFVEGLSLLMQQQPDLEVVGDAREATGALAVVDAAHPDVAVVDVSLAGSSGISLVRDLVRRECRVLMLSMYAEQVYVKQALEAGALGYALKDQPASEVLEAIRTVGAGRRYLASKVARFAAAPSPDAEVDPLKALSPREREIFTALVDGESNHEIAAQLGISVKTVETHRTRVLAKLDVHSIVDLVRFAVRHGLMRKGD